MRSTLASGKGPCLGLHISLSGTHAVQPYWLPIATTILYIVFEAQASLDNESVIYSRGTCVLGMVLLPPVSFRAGIWKGLARHRADGSSHHASWSHEHHAETHGYYQSQNATKNEASLVNTTMQKLHNPGDNIALVLFFSKKAVNYKCQRM